MPHARMPSPVSRTLSTMRTPWWSAQVRACPHPPDTRIRANASSGISPISHAHTASATCIPADSPNTRTSTPTGRGGAATSTSTAIWPRPRIRTGCCAVCSTAMTTRSSPRMLTTASSEPASPTTACSARRAITGCSKAHAPAPPAPTITSGMSSACYSRKASPSRT